MEFQGRVLGRVQIPGVNHTDFDAGQFGRYSFKAAEKKIGRYLHTFDFAIAISHSVLKLHIKAVDSIVKSPASVMTA